jgi:membrane protease YdiL (CAAX protease family)
MLGLAIDVTWKTVLSLAVAGGGAALLFVQVRAVQRDDRAQDAARRALDSVREYLPSSRDEVQLFRGIAYSAGIGEELFYRGFLIWYLDQLVPLVWAVVASSVLFGIAHIMHGMAATVRATVMGFVLAGLFLFSGALWPSMLLHTAVDLSSGAMARAVYGRAPSVAA